MNALQEATKRRPFSNGTEYIAWTSVWCDMCVHDHSTHDGSGSGCDIGDFFIFAVADSSMQWPEALIPEPPDEFNLPSAMVCMRFAACTEDGCEGDRQPEARAKQIAYTTERWRSL